MTDSKYITLVQKIAVRLAIFSILIAGSGYEACAAQRINNDAPPLRERMFFGGNFGLQFGTITNIEIAPIAGLWVLPRVAIAAGPEYTYYARKSIGSTSIFGGRVYTQLVLIQDLNNIIPAGIHLGLFLHAEDEIQSLESETPFWVNNNVDTERFKVNAVLLGGGISQPIGRKGSFNIEMLWTVTDDIYELYSNPEIRFTFTF